jgi:hypothetical protein
MFLVSRTPVLLDCTTERSACPRDTLTLSALAVTDPPQAPGSLLGVVGWSGEGAASDHRPSLFPTERDIFPRRFRASVEDTVCASRCGMPPGRGSRGSPPLGCLQARVPRLRGEPAHDSLKANPCQLHGLRGLFHSAGKKFHILCCWERQQYNIGMRPGLGSEDRVQELGAGGPGGGKGSEGRNREASGASGADRARRALR